MDVLNKWGEEMSRYIEVDDAASAIYHHFPSIRTMAEARGIIEEAPTIDAVSVVHGEWKPFDQAWGRQIWYCTACETSMHMPTKMGKPMYEYCPYCGAKMKGADDE